MTPIRRVDGHNCKGCYSLKQWKDVYYCRSYKLDDGMGYPDYLGFNVVKFWYRLITNDELNSTTRPSWCPIENGE